MFKREKKTQIDWLRLSYVEMASGIEVFYTARLLRSNAYIQKKILEHALDEYRHSNIFRRLWKQTGQESSISTTNGLLRVAGLEQSKIKRNEKGILRWCSYLYVGEFRAIDFNKQATKAITNTGILRLISEIEEDEKNHAKGISRYLARHPRRSYWLFIQRFRLGYFLQRLFKNKLMESLQSKTSGVLIALLLSRLPRQLLELDESSKSLSDSITQAERLV